MLEPVQSQGGTAGPGAREAGPFNQVKLGNAAIHDFAGELFTSDKGAFTNPTRRRTSSAGLLAALGALGPAVLAERRGFGVGPAWHSRRDAIAGLGAAVGIATGGTGKLARDVALLMLPEVAEPAITGRGKEVAAWIAAIRDERAGSSRNVWHARRRIAAVKPVYSSFPQIRRILSLRYSRS